MRLVHYEFVDSLSIRLPGSFRGSQGLICAMQSGVYERFHNFSQSVLARVASSINFV
jgi:hypothetical protein